MEQHAYILYVAGDSDLATRALANFERIVRPGLRGSCSLKVVDILREPRLARANRVVATPLLVREQPQPVIKILGDLSQEEKLISQLGLNGRSANHDRAEEKAP